jgi:large subunit ribosomal protein L13
MQLTKSMKSNEVKRDWVVVDAAGKRFGRVLTEVATLLRGKHKPCFTPNVDCGDFVVIINAEKVEFSGNKMETKEYHRHTGYFGGVRTDKIADLLENNPLKLYKLGTRGMLPKSNLGKEMLKKLKVYAGSEHPHTAQVSKSEGSK